MRRTPYLILLVALASCAKLEPTNANDTLIDYATAIAQAEVSEEPGGKSDLMRCVKNWETSRVLRAHSLKVSNDTGGSVLLEIGSSGYSHYDYTQIDGMLLRNRNGSTVDVSQTPLGNILRKLYKHLPRDFTGSARSETDDGECYFLTIKTPSSSKTVAFYGAPSSTSSGALVHEMLAASRGSDE